jgi:hypothetical protein
MISPKGIERFESPDDYERLDELEHGFIVDVTLPEPHFEFQTGE